MNFVKFLLTACCLSVCGSILTAQTPWAPVGERTIAYDFGGKRTPIWHLGTLFVIEEPNTFVAFGRDGKQLLRHSVSIPDAKQVRLWSLARRNDGGWIASGDAQSADRGSGFLALLDRDGRAHSLVRTGTFLPQSVVSAKDGSIWAAGDQVYRSAPSYDPSASLLRRFSAEGVELGAWLPVRDFPREKGPVTSRSFLSADGERVAWYSERAGVMVLMSLAGKEEGRHPAIQVPPGESVNGFTLCRGGTPYATVHSPQAKGWRLMEFQIASGQWAEIAKGPSWGRIYGCDADQLVFTNGLPKVSFWSRR